jgi:ABC-type antimicrobial peptide transport system permease subunit
LRKLLRLSIVAFVVFLAILFGGPLTSGAVCLLLPAPSPAVDHDLPADYEPLHKGGVDLATGLYVRENEDLIVRGTPAPRFYTSVLALFAGVGLVLATIGVFGVMSYSVAQRAREISIRLALGALPRDVLRMIVGRGLGVSAIGVVGGLATAVALGRFIQGQLFGVALVDPMTFGVVPLVLGASAALASFLPARRSMKLDPANALREG